MLGTKAHPAHSAPTWVATVTADALVALMPTMLSVSKPVKLEFDSTVPSTIRAVRSAVKPPPPPPLLAANGLELTFSLLPCSVSVTNTPPLSCRGGCRQGFGGGKQCAAAQPQQEAPRTQAGTRSLRSQAGKCPKPVHPHHYLAGGVEQQRPRCIRRLQGCPRQLRRQPGGVTGAGPPAGKHQRQGAFQADLGVREGRREGECYRFVDRGAI